MILKCIIPLIFNHFHIVLSHLLFLSRFLAQGRRNLNVFMYACQNLSPFTPKLVHIAMKVTDRFSIEGTQVPTFLLGQPCTPLQQDEMAPDCPAGHIEPQNKKKQFIKFGWTKTIGDGPTQRGLKASCWPTWRLVKLIRCVSSAGLCSKSKAGVGSSSGTADMQVTHACRSQHLSQVDITHTDTRQRQCPGPNNGPASDCSGLTRRIKIGCCRTVW